MRISRKQAQQDVVTFFDVVDRVTPRDDNTGRLVSEQARASLGGIVEAVELRMANSGCELLYDDMMWTWIGKLDLVDDDGLAELHVYSGDRVAKHQLSAPFVLPPPILMPVLHRAPAAGAAIFARCP
jgi:hypothetical protein